MERSLISSAVARDASAVQLPFPTAEEVPPMVDFGHAAHVTGEELTAYLHNRLDSDAARRVAEHVGRCDRCRAAYRHAAESRVGADAAGHSGEQMFGGAFSDSGAPASGTASSRAAAADVPEALANHPKFRVLRRLDMGGMGVVYLCEHVLLRRLVAVKTIRADLQNEPEVLQRFRDEVAALGRTMHGNIVKPLDAELVGGQALLVTEYVEGITLQELVQRRGPLPVAEACSYALQVARALAHAHHKGVIHRDIKPKNVLWTSGGTVKVVDFGLARLAGELQRDGNAGHASGGPGDADRLTAELDSFVGSAEMHGVGTPDYVAPEQCCYSGLADERSDIYSLGCTLYFLLTGEVPFPGKNAQETIARKLNESPPVLSPHFPERLRRIVARMMAPDPGDRIQTAVEVCEALAPFARPTSEVGHGGGVRDAEKPDVFAARKPSWRVERAGVAGLLAACIVALGLWLVNRPEKSPQREGTRAEAVSEAVRDGYVARRGHEGTVRRVAASSRPSVVVTAGLDGKVVLWEDRNAPLEPSDEFRLGTPIRNLQFARARPVLVACGDGLLAVIDLHSRTIARRFELDGRQATAATFVDGDRTILFCTVDGRLHRWEWRDGLPREVRRLTLPAFATFSRDGKAFLLSAGGRNVHYGLVADPAPPRVFAGHEGAVRCVALSSNGKWALTGSEDTTVRFWPLADGGSARVLRGHRGTVRCVAFTSDDRFGISGGDDGTVRVWDLSGGRFEEILVLRNPSGAAVWCVADLPQSAGIVAGDAAGTVHLWNRRW
ncbi:MAG: hypothetical protein D6725_10460 [Planctomycetota bacterium]|nr:MAG: hypothetical protein D6725_10460 [Planctomycetota bacterium]